METKNLSENELEQNCVEDNSEHKEIQEPNNLIKTELLNTLDKKSWFIINYYERNCL